MQKTKTSSGLTLEKKNTILACAFLFPAVLFIALFSYYPSIRGIIMAFQKVNAFDLAHTPFNGLENFRRLFAIRGFWSFWTNTFIWVVGCVGSELIIGFVVALLLQKNFTGKRIYESIIFIPWALSGFIVGIIFKWIFNGSTGLINDILFRLGLISVPIGFLSTAKYALSSVMVAKVWTGMAFFSIVIGAALKTIPRELYESAEIDGANKAQSFFHITLPSLRILLLFTILMRALSTFSNAELIFSMTGGGPANASHTVNSWILVSLIAATDYGLISATGVSIWIFLTLCSAMYLFFTKAYKRGD